MTTMYDADRLDWCIGPEPIFEPNDEYSTTLWAMGRVLELEEENKELKKENERLKDAHIFAISGFHIDPLEWQEVSEFTLEHNKRHGTTGATNGDFVFSFLPRKGRGILATVKCVECGKTHCFRD